jgi:hypothetical protein
MASLIFALCIPLILALLALFAAGLVILFHKIKCTADLERSHFKTSAAKAFTIALSLAYFSIIVNVVQIFGCTSAANLSSVHFLNMYLHI